uniref:Uncharacterized protein n=1 Tax=Meloidogyne floridensis TaxID=298350 RepID=A0A915NIN7_9BILA
MAKLLFLLKVNNEKEKVKESKSKIVGLADHKLDEDNKVILAEGSNVVKTPGDVKHYKKHFADKSGIKFKVGMNYDGECLTDSTVDNLIPFVYGLTNEEIEKHQSRPVTSNKECKGCGDKNKCIARTCNALESTCSSYTIVSAQRCELIIVFRGTKTNEQLFLEGWQSLQPGVDFDGIYFLALLHHLLQHEQLNRKLEDCPFSSQSQQRHSHFFADAEHHAPLLDETLHTRDAARKLDKGWTHGLLYSRRTTNHPRLVPFHRKRITSYKECKGCGDNSS